MDPLAKAEIGATGLQVTRLGLGGAPFGGLSEDVAQQCATESIAAGLDLGIRYFDTAPLYGNGRSERYYASALKGVDRNS
ncbi:MAG: aldo/keto reductase, partial [Chloroflexi bacterium]|nr:aldo/keto reductase [Chloroflexota bacterium]